METTITFEVDSDKLSSCNDDYLASLWFIAQANPAPMEDRDACRIAEHMSKNTTPTQWINGRLRNSIN